ncbi:ABC transporter ATP-binding protein/permease [Cellulomonas sp. C5510]|nr:ABC transporter ATP-binding protein/permease [Cellulomonas sp. C5510]
MPRFLLWQAARQPGTLVGGVLFGVLWMLCQVAWPYLLGRAVDEGVTGEPRDVLGWCGALLAVAVAQAATTTLRHRMAVTNWLRSSLGVARLVGHHSAGTGHAITATTAQGEIVATVSGDTLRLGEMFDVVARLAGGLVAYLCVAAVVAARSSALGVLVLVGVPVLAAALSLLIGPLQRRQQAYRHETGLLTTLGADTVAGLRVLRGIGGEDAFVDRYARQSQRARVAAVEVARTQSWLDGMQVLLPGVLVAALVWAGARLVAAGSLTAGELVTLYGYATFLVVPLRTGAEAAQVFTRGVVAARRVLAVLRIRPAVQDPGDPVEPPPRGAGLEDTASGLVVAPGRFTAVVDTDPDAAAAVATRLGRFDDAALRDAPVLWGGVDHRAVRVREVRRRIVVSDTTPHLFAGPLGDGLDVLAVREPDRARAHPRHGRIDAALDAAAARETVDALPGGLGAPVAERGRTFSGGQRQRLSLARALLTDAEVLVLVEPTSAVDAHTESLIAGGVRRAREGRTTVVVTESPLLLDRVDVVQVMDHGRVVGSGTHGELLRRADEVGDLYRSVVARTSSPAEPEPGVDPGGAEAGGVDALWDEGVHAGTLPAPAPPAQRVPPPARRRDGHVVLPPPGRHEALPPEPPAAPPGTPADDPHPDAPEGTDAPADR